MIGIKAPAPARNVQQLLERPAESFSREEVLNLIREAREAADIITRTDRPIIRQALALYNQDLLTVVHHAVSEGNAWK